MHVLVFIVWIISLVALAADASRTRPAWNLTSIGLFLFDLWIGLHALIVSDDPITLDM